MRLSLTKISILFYLCSTALLISTVLLLYGYFYNASMARERAYYAQSAQDAAAQIDLSFASMREYLAQLANSEAITQYGKANAKIEYADIRLLRELLRASAAQSQAIDFIRLTLKTAIWTPT